MDQKDLLDELRRLRATIRHLRDALRRTHDNLAAADRDSAKQCYIQNMPVGTSAVGGPPVCLRMPTSSILIKQPQAQGFSIIYDPVTNPILGLGQCTLPKTMKEDGHWVICVHTQVHLSMTLSTSVSQGRDSIPLTSSEMGLVPSLTRITTIGVGREWVSAHPRQGPRVGDPSSPIPDPFGPIP
jgi:hypothetical protein